MLENINLERMRSRLHGVDSSLFLLKENEPVWQTLIEIVSDFTVTRQRDVPEGGMKDVLTLRILSNDIKTAFDKCDGCILRIGEQMFRYAVENKENVATRNFVVGYANVRAIFNDATTVEPIVEPVEDEPDEPDEP